MVRWFRHYPGLARDGKLMAVALRSGQPIERVVWLWCAILEDAAERGADGQFSIDVLEAAHFLRCEQEDLELILAGFDESGRTAAGVVQAWQTRQFIDNSTARVRRHRQGRTAERMQ